MGDQNIIETLVTLKKSNKVEILEKRLMLDEFFHVEVFKLRHKLLTEEWSPVLDRYILHRPDAVCAVVHNTDQDCIYLVKQFRPGAYLKDEGWLCELAAGLVDEDETKEDAIRREVMEELGFQFDEALLLNRFFASPGILTERIFLYYIQVTDKDRVTAGGGLDSENEDIEVIQIPSSQIDAFQRENAILDAKTLIGLLSFKNIWNNYQDKKEGTPPK